MGALTNSETFTDSGALSNGTSRKRRRGRKVSSTTVESESPLEQTANSEIGEITKENKSGEILERCCKNSAPSAPSPLKSGAEEAAASTSDEVDMSPGDGMIHEDSRNDINVGESTRSRGKKRKGRKQTSDIVVEGEAKQPKNETILEEKITGECASSSDVGGDKKRRCIGRKPVTDFVVGESYSGKVVYVKSFGLFLDIGCHSDAFCHISRVSDGYVESLNDMFKEGDIVKARVVDIDRKQKRITVSMQSENRIEDELSSMKTWKDRSEKHHSKKSNKKESNNDKQSNKKESSNDKQSKKKEPSNDKLTPLKLAPEGVLNVAQSPHVATVDDRKSAKVDGLMTPAELKRERKLARRAERRGQS